MLQVEHLTKRYGAVTAVDDLSFEIAGAGVYGFLGPNGAGKSTTMNIMTGCLSATAGTVKISGYDIYESPREAKRRVGYLPEPPPLYLGETPAEFLRFVGEAKGLRGAELRRQIDAVVEETGIGDMRQRRISALSKGYRQRVGISRTSAEGSAPRASISRTSAGKRRPAAPRRRRRAKRRRRARSRRRRGRRLRRAKAAGMPARPRSAALKPAACRPSADLAARAQPAARAPAARSRNTASASASSPPRSSSPCFTAEGRGADEGPPARPPGRDNRPGKRNVKRVARKRGPSCC